MGEADAYGHRKKIDIGHAFAQEIEKRTGEETMASDLTYDLRGGAPDAIDQIVATTFGNIAVDLIRDGVTGRMVGIQDGRYAHSRACRILARARARSISKSSTTPSATGPTTRPNSGLRCSLQAMHR